jgi:acetylornithine deacetylase/succinyl-diaminopimelate desuccinylase-like protein
MSDHETYLADNDSRFIDELVDFLRIPSISSLPDHATHVAAAAEWAAQRCRDAGLEEVTILPTQGHPTVYAQWLGAPEAPTILIYGHVDVQPVDPLDEWTSGPFEPRVTDDGEESRVYARGANDDKGNMLPPILAIEALLKTTGRLPVNVKLLLEGEEEIGSPHLLALLEAQKERLACDLVLSADGGGLACDGSAPVMMTGYRGLAALEIAIDGPGSDLHSGAYGGVVENPLRALSQLLGTLHDAEGRVLVDGFYDEVLDPMEEEREMLAAAPFDESQLTQSLGVDQLIGDPAYAPRERLWLRPTLEINGMWGGFQGAGIKTVIPRVAHAKISCRLVPNQEPTQILANLEAHLRRHLPPGVKMRVTDQEDGARPYVLSPDHPGLAAARSVAADVCGQFPYLARSGGTLPVCDLLLRTLGTFTVTFAAAAYDEGAHAPDEFFRLASFRRMQRAYCALLHRLGQTRL